MTLVVHTSAVTSGPSYDNVQMLEDDEGLKVTITGTTLLATLYLQKLLSLPI